MKWIKQAICCFRLWLAFKFFEQTVPVPFCFARHGLLSNSVSNDDIAALYIAAVKRSLGPFQAATLDAAIARNRAGFAALSLAIMGDPKCQFCSMIQVSVTHGHCFICTKNWAVEIACGTSPWKWDRCTRQWSFSRAVLCLDQHISAVQPSLRGTVRPDYLSYYEDGPSYSLRCWRSRTRCYHDPIANTLEVPMESISQHSGFIIMMMMLNHSKRMLNESLAIAAFEFELMLINLLPISRLSVWIDFDWRQWAL